MKTKTKNNNQEGAAHLIARSRVCLFCLLFDSNWIGALALSPPTSTSTSTSLESKLTKPKQNYGII